MTKIKATFLEGDTKYHISRPGGVPACNADAYFPYSNKTELPRQSVCKNCLRSSRAEYEEIPQHIAAMPEGYRIMKVGETITEECMFWSMTVGPWKSAYSHECGGKLLFGRVAFCCPVDVQKTSDNADRGEPVSDKCEYCKGTGYYGDNGPGIEGNEEYHECEQCKVDPENCDCRFWARTDLTLDEYSGPLRHHPRCEHRVEYHGGFATPDERDRLQHRIAELERKNELLIHAIEANPSKAKVAELERERDELKRKVDQLIAIDKRVTDYIDDLHREHEAEVNELKRRLDASAEASVHERTTVAMLTEKLEKAEAERDDYRSQIIEIEKAHDALCDATKGYTLENITTFIEAMPPAEDLEGYEVEYRYPRIGDSAWLNHELRWKVVEKEQRCGISAIVRTPIIEYIPTEDITDALARDRVVCDVRYSCKTQWIPAVLLVVDGRPEKSVKYLVQLIESDDFVWFQADHCRIRKDTIERLRGKK